MNAVRHFNGEYWLSESTVCDFKTKYLKELKIQGNPDRVTSLTHSNRGRPSLVGSVLDDKVADYLRDLRTQGCPVNRTIASASVKGIIYSHDKSLLSENGGPLSIGLPWIRSFLQRQGYVKRKATKAARKLPENFDQEKCKFIERIKSACDNYGITDSHMIVNIDQTGLNLHHN